jgi:cobalt transporter subunit CbtB
MRRAAKPVGCDGTGVNDMTTQTRTAKASASALVPAILAMLIGVGVTFVTGHLQAQTLHDAAHDVRHATGFPCH